MDRAHGPRVGRILTAAERTGRMADEIAYSIPGETRRTGFAISDQHVLTAWHCVREPLRRHEQFWFRLRDDDVRDRRYFYVPLRVTNYNERLDVAALAVDWPRLGEADLFAADARAILASAAILLGADFKLHDKAQIVGFPDTAPGADSDTNSGEVVETTLPLGEASGFKLFCGALAAVDPVHPHGLSGAPVLQVVPGPGGYFQVAVGLVRAAPIGSMPGVAAGGALVASRLEDAAAHIPEIAIRLPAEAAVSRATQVPPGGEHVQALLASCYTALQDAVVEFDDATLGTLTGWSHFLDESLTRTRPTAVGTAYGLKLALALERNGSLNRSALAETLWKLRKPDGGWAARTQSGVGRPEITALVLGTLSAAGFESAALTEAVGAFEESLSPGKDPVGMSSTYVVSAAIRGLVSAGPASARLPELRALLLAGAIQDPGQDNLLCWSDRFTPKRDQVLQPSVPHTAQAVVALARAGTVLGDDAPSRSALVQATRWLVGQPGAANQVEHLRRIVTEEHWEMHAIRHFTAAWKARAIMASYPASVPEAGSALVDAVRQVWQAQAGGVWHLDANDRPVWMTYQGARVLRDYAMYTCTMP